MPVVSYTSLSTDPPLVGVSCDPRAFTYLLISKEGSSRFASSTEFIFRPWSSSRLIRRRNTADKLADSDSIIAREGSWAFPSSRILLLC